MSSSQLFEHHHIVVDAKQKPMRLDCFLVARLPSITRTRLQQGMRHGSVHVNGKAAKSSHKIKPHDCIKVLLPTPPKTYKLVPEDLPLDIVYEDDDLLIVNKPPELVVHPGFGNWSGTLMHRLVHYLKNLPHQPNNHMRPGLLHRLDKGTSGLLSIAKTDTALQYMTKQFAQHTIQRTYVALVWGDVERNQGTINQPIARSISDRKKMAIPKQKLQGKRAITHYNVLERLGYVTLIQCQLETGRTHQIRVHMAYLGHPLFGDPLYGGNKILKGQAFSKYKSFVQNCFALLPHQALHAKTLSFQHPATHEQLTLTSPLPHAFDTVLQKWKKVAWGPAGK